MLGKRSVFTAVFLVEFRRGQYRGCYVSRIETENDNIVNHEITEETCEALLTNEELAGKIVSYLHSRGVKAVSYTVYTTQ